MEEFLVLSFILTECSHVQGQGVRHDVGKSLGCCEGWWHRNKGLCHSSLMHNIQVRVMNSNVTSHKMSGSNYNTRL